ncbi:hypothetical protein ANCDUO_25783, partial [Ancylostoma duodenale]
LCSPEGGHSPRITPFSGDGESPQFSIWLRRLEDILRMRAIAPTSEQKANFLVGYLDGVAREKIEELSLDERKDFDRIVAHLKNYFESPQQRNMARQLLSSCRQEIGESATIFPNRLLNLVRAATSGQDQATQKERVLEEFVARLPPDIRYYVKLDEPVTFEQAVNKAQTVEQLLAEATVDRLINPTSALSSSTPPVQALQTRHVRFQNSTDDSSVYQALVRGMLEQSVDSSSIALITFYKEQHRCLEDFAKETGIDISTVDSVQGRERDVVILLTTKTDSDLDASEFLDAPRRMNVALTRCRHGQMVVGHRPSLARLPQWRRVIHWALDRMAVIPDADVQRLFGDQ